MILKLKDDKIKTLIILLLIAGLLAGLCVGGFSKEKSPKKGETRKVPVFGQEFSGPEYVPGQILVKFKSLATRSQILSINRKLKANIVKEYAFPNGLVIYLLALPDTKGVSEAIEEFEKEPLVEYAEPDRIVHVFGSSTPLDIPNDPYFDDLWGLHNTGQTGGTSDADIDAPEAWDICNGSDEIVIADID